MKKLILPFVLAILAICLACNILLLLQVQKLQKSVDAKVSSSEYQNGLSVQGKEIKKIENNVSDIDSTVSDIQSTVEVLQR